MTVTMGFYLYTLFIMLACIMAGTLALSSYFVSRNRGHLYAMSFFFFYFFDLALIFQYEFIGQNVAFDMTSFYAIDFPWLKTALSLGSLTSLWLVVCHYLDERRVWMRVLPSIVYFVACIAIVSFMQEGSSRQFAYYGMRQVYLLWVVVYCAARYAMSTDRYERIRMRRHIRAFALAFVLLVCVELEDSFMILSWAPSASSVHNLLPLYLSERNISENLLALLFAACSLKASSEVLRLRFNEPLSVDSSDKRRHADELMPAFCTRHGLTQREREVLVHVLMGEDNQNIASELQLALGTVKTHTHNILKKTGSSTRQELMQTFWKD